MKLSDFDFELPEDLIATRPMNPRSAAKLLFAEGDAFHDKTVGDLLDLFQVGDRLVLNNTRVIPARLNGVRKRHGVQGGSGKAKIEVTLLDPDAEGCWSALIKPLRKVELGEVITFNDQFHAELCEKRDGQAILRFNLTGDAFDAALEEAGAMPLPPYIASKRAADEQDKEDYQTVFAKHHGSVAAPTASLHFDEGLLDALIAKGVDITYVTLHVGAGTFLPVKVDDVTTHKMHKERGEVTPEAAAEILATKSASGRVIPVGTTALRLVETAARDTGQIAPWKGATNIFIYPGFEFHVADALMTNFHLPKSTLIMLVSAFIGAERTKKLYNHAVTHRYRFFSYGDASLLIP
ncbi:MAG: tRNA preQ1(34) S-adenosylmethionine ribosyltransferase-isomerase QueA [Rhodobacteraceae bacterium]|nr:tRNA preQ1(34) S-adenosylmethionine ribosyltransferase-isomerase QueA [Paracoccaceae bacterium]